MRKILFSLIVPLVLGMGVSTTVAQDYPSGTIEMITPFAPGGSTDTSARLFASALGKYLPNQVDVVVVNRPGGSTTVGMSAIQNAPADGYTIGLTSNSPVTIQPHFQGASYSYDSFEPIVRLVDIPQVLLVQADAPWADFDEWLTHVKENPGAFTYATPGNGSISDLAMAVLNEAAEIETRAIPYDSGGRAMAAVLGGNVGGVATFQGNADPSLVRPLINFSSTRSSMHPDIPTLRDAGYEAHKDAFIGIVAPKGVDAEIVEVLHDAFTQALEDPEVVEALANQSFEIAYEGPEEFAETLKEDFEHNGQLLRRAGLID
ncbi:Bug family tripartite tricarboxylate transporter substrate binding protein [Pararhizobium haloflavum]|uniref:Bug family tripartite tricarboxylate transporter substrate binding protein n=1 Tax=Pararhizobium haloflavum TaxID=2037914 RepID=UPI000C1A818B|nr:tripartite tricarboxylate transporter substrate binding protein [Pararhizobium haloflavum]